MALDLAAMVAGANIRGEFEDRLKAVLKEISEAEGQIILFHRRVAYLGWRGRCGRSHRCFQHAEAGIGSRRVAGIGATTLNEYKQIYRERPALERRFQPVLVAEPKVEDTIAILRGLKERYEVHHGVRIKDAAIVAAATLSHRYISDRFLPDKAIDLIDEARPACACRSIPCPPKSMNSSARITQLEIERQALTEETDAAIRRAARADRKRAGRAAGRSERTESTLASRKRSHQQDSHTERANRAAQG